MSDSRESWHDLGPVGDQPKNRVFDMGADEVWIFRQDATFVAVSNICPHKMGPISEGILENGIVECPWHGYRFSVCNGASENEHCPSLRTYETTVCDGHLFVREKVR